MIPLLGKVINFKDYTPSGCQNIVHWMPWWNTPGHIKMQYPLPGGPVPYDSSNQSICDDQAQKMIEMGITGINVDFYGPEAPSALACLRMLNSCERFGLSYSLCIDQGALKTLTGDAATNEYIRILLFAGDACFTSPSYLKDAGRYVVNFFGEPAGVNWTTIRKAIPMKLALIFQGSSGFTHPESDGSFGWINPLPDPKDFNKTAVQAFAASSAVNSSKMALCPVYSGFDDSMAGWSKGRYMSRRLGQTLLDTLGLVPIGAKYVLIPTWNDYEEHSDIEASQG